MLKPKFFCALLSFAIFAGVPSFGQKVSIAPEDLTQLKQLEDSLIITADSMLTTGIPDDRINYCVRFGKYLRTALDIENAYQYPFDSLAKKIHILSPADKSFRIFNWMVAPTEIVRRYYGAVQLPDGKFYPLKDYSETLESEAETAILPADRWFGCEYYKILPQTIQGQKSYLLFGFSTNGMSSNKKILDVLTFGENGLSFGAPVFLMPETKGQRLITKSRVILEYKKSAQVSLNYDDTKKMIMFNRLASEINDPNRKNTYAPTGQTDGLRFENGQYIFVKDAIQVLKLQDGQAPVDGVMQGG